MKNISVSLLLSCALLCWTRPLLGDGLLKRVTDSVTSRDQAKPVPKPPRRVESYVTAPVTLADVRALHHPPDQEVRETRRSHDSMQGGSCHSQSCLIYLPLLLLPSSHTTVLTVIRGGRPTYEAEFDGERFLWADIQDGPRRTGIRALSLDALGREIVVAVSKTDAKRLPIQPQVDLLSSYQTALRSAKDPKERQNLLTEALRVLQDEALPLITPAQKIEPLSDDQKAELASVICYWDDHAARSRALQPLPIETSWQTSLEVIKNCPAIGQPLPAPLLEAAQKSVIRALCGPASAQVVESLRPRRLLGTGSAEETQLPLPEGVSFPALVSEIERCPLPRRAGVRALYNQPLPSAELRASLAAGDLLSPRVLASFPRDELAAHRAELLAAVASPQALHDRLLRVFYGMPSPVQTAEEFLLLAQAYATHSLRPQQAAILYLFSTSHASSAAVQSAKAKALDWLHTRLAQGSAAQAPAIELALVVLGERDRALAAARGLGPFTLRSHVSTRLLTSSMEGVKTEPDLISYGLRLAGCSSDGLVAAHRMAAASAAAQKGAACTTARE